MATKAGRDDSDQFVPAHRAEQAKDGIDRRFFLKVLGVAGASATQIGQPQAAEAPAPQADPYGVLVDTTRCAGCRNCELVCAEAHGLPEPALEDTDLQRERKTSETQWSVINRFETDVGEAFVKRQCMHCIQPACASACLTKAMLKTARGPVVWRESKCMGCRFCMVSCPFDGPKFEYDSPMPRIQKCNLCWERLEQGGQPACVENCPAEALLFGTRSELIDEAHRRIQENPDQYVHAIYGEHDVGGTTWLYLSAAPFEQIGFRKDLGTTAYPELTVGFLYGVPVILTLVPAFLLALSQATKQETETADSGAVNGQPESIRDVSVE
jgi:Fe-S-cluster-containing dehydrogenase component